MIGNIQVRAFSSNKLQLFSYTILEDYTVQSKGEKTGINLEVYMVMEVGGGGGGRPPSPTLLYGDRLGVSVRVDLALKQF